MSGDQVAPGKRPDAGVFRALAELGVAADELLGFGGEAWVFADGPDRVLRVHHPHVPRSSVDRRTRLLAELGASDARVPFAIPTVLETVVASGRVVTVERRLAGRPLTSALGAARGAERRALVRRYLDAAAALGDLALDRATYGDLTRDDAIDAPTFRGYLARRAEASLRAAGPDFAGVSPASLADAWPEPEAPAFVHLDAFPGNMLAEGGRITAVVDFGTVSIAGDRRLDPLAAAAYLAPEITPTAGAADRETARAWLAERGLLGLAHAAERWIAAYWSAARDDARLHRFCRGVLL